MLSGSAATRPSRASRGAGVGLSSTIHPTVIRAVTHLDVDDEGIDRAIALAPEALGARVAA